MDRGTYVAASGGSLQLRKLEVVNNNLANVNTVGYKAQKLSAQQHTFEQTLASSIATSDPFARGDHDRAPGITDVQSSTDFSPGAIRDTGNPLDVALRNPKDFFVIDVNGETQYTRAGNFTLNSEGELVTQDGMRVQGDGGAITIAGGAPTITSGGMISVGREVVGRLQVVRFSDPQSLAREAGVRFKVGGGGSAAPEQVDAEVVPASLEMANVSAITGVVELISTQRAFEMYTKSAQSIDQLNQAAISQVGRRGG